jgi:Mrp family chromosome partitioning ATPase
MSSIADALKRAQQERDRLKGAPAAPSPPPSAIPVPAHPDAPHENAPPPSLASVVLRRNPAESSAPVDHPPHADAPPDLKNPLARAMRQAPTEPAPAVRQQQRLAETIVEDYTSKRNLNLPPAMVVYHDRAGPVAEQYRRIRDNLMQANPRREHQSLVITSTRPDEGKTVTAMNLALSLVEIRSNRVLLVDGCLHAARLHATLTNLLHLQSEPGLAELLASSPASAPASSPLSATAPADAPVDRFLKATPWHNLFILPSGARTAPAASAELLRSATLPATLRHLRSSFDWILIDAPAASLFPDAGLLGAATDGLLLAVALHHTPYAQVQNTLRRLKSMNLPLKSCILTRA